MLGENIETAGLAVLDDEWSEVSERVRANARSLATRELKDLFRFRDTRELTVVSAPVEDAIELTARALVANVSVMHPDILGRLLVLLAPVLDQRLPLRIAPRR